MAGFDSDHIRNLALMGHAGSGKSSLAEALLIKAGVIADGDHRGRASSSAGGSEQQASHSIESSILHLEHHSTRINLLDTPGYSDLFGRAMAVLPAVESIALVINARHGIEPVTRKAYEQMLERNKCGMIVINQIDAADADPAKILAEIQQTFGGHCLPINLPSSDKQGVVDCYFHPDYEAATDLSSVTEAHDRLVEQVIEVDEQLMELYLEQEQSIEPPQLHDPFEQALRDGHLIPVCFTSAETGAGLELLLDVIAEQMPLPKEGNPPLFLKGEGEAVVPVLVTSDASQHAIAHVFKVTIDPFKGKLAVFRIHQGTIKTGSQMFIGDGRKPFKVNHLFKLLGDELREVSHAGPGEICAVAKVDELHFDAVIHDSHDEDHYHLKALAFPASMASVAISPAKHGDEQKLSDILHRIVEEDPSLLVEHRERQNETVLCGLGELHLNAVLEKMQSVYNLEIHSAAPSIPYRETIQIKAEGHHRHKKQSGGSGQFGEVFLRIEPLAPGQSFEFTSEVVGGAIPGQFIPAVEKGVREVMESGAVAGYPMQDIRVVVYDGKHHSVDSKEIAFATAGKKAFIHAVQAARPVILEPYAEAKITAPGQCTGDITGQLSSERAMITGSAALDNGLVEITAKVPLVSMTEYSNHLKSITSGEGEYSMSFSHYDAVPSEIQEQLIQAAKS
ncbi:elongation factor G [Endozoicomonas sp. OPT23]|uniref:elongation factor G n=1 Tax=Endozoicomonas sp. OPT23 TaxID=2072845 RepID=UPI00129C05E9|nr:elongation factor G [Endozoicomonas sp. OPT23]MRI33057.1 elongation factor G [Endozoicomonas sp. OPT23]